MDKGSSGPDVAELQSHLQSLGFVITDPKGVFGNSTDEVVRAFQQASALTVDGIVGRQTLATLTASVVRVDTDASFKEGQLSLLDYQGLLRSFNVKNDTWSTALYDAMLWAGFIDSPKQVAAFTANVLVESACLTVFTENLNYSSTALRSLWPNRFTVEQAERYGRTPSHSADQRMIANLAYGSRNGNRGTDTDDGWNYRGRGPFQLTFSGNYLAFQSATGVPAMENPSLVAKPAEGSKAAAWYFKENNLGKYAEQSDWTVVGRKINGGDNGLGERIDFSEKLAWRLEPLYS